MSFRHCSLAAVLAVLFLVGCGGSSDGPTRYRVRGSVTFNGKPVPKGFVTLEPNSDQGNSGPGGGAEIKNGQYDTGRDAGVVGGSYKVRVVGTDGMATTMSGEELPDGTPLFAPYEFVFEFPQDATTKDIEVPAGK